jgi:mono/diheme cytochrome c family protein
VKPKGRIDETLDQALRRLGAPPSEVLESVRDRIRQNLRSTNPSDTTPLSLTETRPAGLWGLRQPFLIAGAVGLALAVLTATTFWILSGRTHTPNIGKVAAEPARSGSAALPPNHADSGGTLRPTESKEVPVAPESKQIPRDKTIRRPLPKPRSEDVKPPDAPTVTGVRPTSPAEPPMPEPAPAQPDGNSGRAVLERVCTVCHSLRGVETHIYASPDAYKDLVSAMISRGAVVSDEEMAAIVEYLYEMYGQK